MRTTIWVGVMAIVGYVTQANGLGNPPLLVMLGLTALALVCVIQDFKDLSI